jgi:hypothetical protein
VSTYSGNDDDFDRNGRDELDPRFPVEGAVVGMDDDNGDDFVLRYLYAIGRRVWALSNVERRRVFSADDGSLLGANAIRNRLAEADASIRAKLRRPA